MNEVSSQHSWGSGAEIGQQTTARSQIHPRVLALGQPACGLAGLATPLRVFWGLLPGETDPGLTQPPHDEITVKFPTRCTSFHHLPLWCCHAVLLAIPS